MHEMIEDVDFETEDGLSQSVKETKDREGMQLRNTTSNKVF